MNSGECATRGLFRVLWEVFYIYLAVLLSIGANYIVNDHVFSLCGFITTVILDK